MSGNLEAIRNEFRKTMEIVRGGFRMKDLLKKYDGVSAAEAFKRACDNERQALCSDNGGLIQFSYALACDEYLELAALLDESYKPAENELTKVQQYLIDRAKHELKDSEWYKGIRLELLPETDKEINSLSYQTVVDRLVKYTIAHDCPYCAENNFAVIKESNGRYVIHYLRDGECAGGEYNMINGSFGESWEHIESGNCVYLRRQLV